MHMPDLRIAWQDASCSESVPEMDDTWMKTKHKVHRIVLARINLSIAR
jgi:hypothetical protein